MQVIAFSFLYMVEMAGVEPASASTTPMTLHVYGFNGWRTDSQDANHEPLKFCSNWRDNNLSYPSCVRFKESNQTNGNLCRPKQPLGC